MKYRDVVGCLSNDQMKLINSLTSLMRKLDVMRRKKNNKDNFLSHKYYFSSSIIKSFRSNYSISQMNFLTKCHTYYCDEIVHSQSIYCLFINCS